jgi:AcrR family transcriptional regulator
MSATAQRQTAILDAALDAFSERGYEATTIADVRRRSGASVGSIYHRFGDKRGLAAALYVECLADYHRGLFDVLAGASDAERGIRAMVRHHLRWVEANPQRAAFLFEHPESEVALASAEPVRTLNEALFERCREWLVPHQAAGRIRRIPLELVYVIVLGPSQEYARAWLRNPERARVAAAERELARAAWRGVRADPDRKEQR